MIEISILNEITIRESLLVIVGYFLVYCFTSKTLGLRFNKIFSWLILILMVVIDIGGQSSGLVAMRIFSSRWILWFVMVLILGAGGLKRNIDFSLIPALIARISETIILSVFYLASNSRFVFLRKIQESTPRVWIVLLASFFLVISIFLHERVSEKFSGWIRHRFSKSFVIASFVILLFSEYIKRKISLQSESQIEILVFTLFALSLLQILFFLEYIYYVNQIKSESEQEAIAQQMISERKQYEQIVKLNHHLLKKQHDRKNQLLLFQTLIAQGKNDEFSRLIRGVISGEKGFEKIPSILRTTLDSQREIMEQQGIDYSETIVIEGGLPLTDEESFSLLSNILSNAREAAVKVNENPFVDCKINYLRKNVRIIVSNSCRELPDSFEVDSMRSAKREFGHGYGLRIINDIVKKNHGILRLEGEGSIFKVIVVLPIKEFGS